MKKKRNILFIKNLALFLIPMLAPLITLGSLSIFITQKHIVDQINKNNTNLLNQTKDNVELILNELDSLNLNFSTNPEIVSKLKRILGEPNPVLQFEDLQSLRSIRYFIDAPAYAKPYIHSIYVTFENPHARLLTTSDGIVQLKDFYDNSWYASWSNKNSNQSMWTELREIKRYDFEKKPVKVLTLYRRLVTLGNNGLMMLNINASYIENLLRQLKTYPRQMVCIVDESNRIIFSNSTQRPFDERYIETLIYKNDYTKEMIIDNTPYVASLLTSQRYGWTYISVVPSSTLYEIPLRLTSLALLLLLLSFLSGLVLAYFITKKNYKHIKNIVSIINSAEKGNPVTDITYMPKDEYGYIVQNLIETFIQRSYLKVQLSERAYKLKVLQLLALQSQINPHFLYNTLETINWKILSITKKPAQANEMVGNLSDILKYCLDNPLKTVTLEDEIKNTCSYIEIQKVRYRDKFSIIWEYDEEDKSLKVMKLILQPLVENSIYHGMKEKKGKGLIKIKIFKQKDCLKISVIDNGLGIPYDKLQIIRQNLLKEDDYYSDDYSNHIGLNNINKRLKLNYGEEYGLVIKSRQGLGTVVHLHIKR